MPNFISSKLKTLDYPYKNKGVEYLWEASDKEEKLVYTKVDGEDFFTLIKKRPSDFVIKCDKLTRPASLGLIQKALDEYKNINKDFIKSCATSIKNEKQLEKKEHIINDIDFLKLLESKKFSKIYIEIGFGSGRHILYQARTNPDILVVGIEVYKPSMEQVNNLAKDYLLDNIALLNLDARLAMSLVSSNLVDKIFLHFPVPWHKSEKRRVVSASFAKECQRVLKVGGKFELRSDDREYSDFTISHFLNLENSQIEIYKDRFLEVSSKYEDRWVRQNKNIYDMIFTNQLFSEIPPLEGDFKFDEDLDEEKIYMNFKNTTMKFQNHFVHFERIYKKTDGGLLLRVAFGSFYRPEHCYILVEDKRARYFIKKPLLTYENLLSHSKIKEHLACKIS